MIILNQIKNITLTDQKIVINPINLAEKFKPVISKTDDLSNIADLRLRVEVLSLNRGSEVIVMKKISNDSKRYGRVINKITKIGKYEYGFNRGEKDRRTTVTASIQVNGTAEFNASLLIAEKGESIEEWL